MVASPARAGMYRATTKPPRPTVRFPRTRGDVPDQPGAGKRRSRLPPHARGCTPDSRRFATLARASPARAGMYLRRAWASDDALRFPRTRGDVPLRQRPTRRGSTLPPHARGCTLRVPPPGAALRASPARAGMYPHDTAARMLLSSFPRTRGDVPNIGFFDAPMPSLPPHARGCTFMLQGFRQARSASPARAGMYLCAIPMWSRWSGFPRTRGDVP